MMIRAARIALGVLMCATTAGAQGITGDWQGTLGSRPLRLLLKIAPEGAGRLSAILISLDEGGFDQPHRASSVVMRDSNVTVSFSATGATYTGRLSSDGSTLSGTWSQGRPTPLEFRRPTRDALWRDPSPHVERFVTVDSNVSVEVLDWGGTGRPIVLLAGLGNTAHVFDQFAPKLAANYRVFGITRRGFGVSSAPAHGYDADRLGDDVIAVLDSLRLDRPILIGHSIAGQELSSIGSRLPDRVAGLVYLDAAYGHAYYDATRGFLAVDLAETARTLARLTAARVTPQSAESLSDIKTRIRELVDSGLPMLQRNLRDYERTLDPVPAPRNAPRLPPYQAAVEEIWAGVRKYTSIRAPTLAIYALPRQIPPTEAPDSAARAAVSVADSARRAAQADAFQKGVPTARVVRLRHATHYVFLSNEQDVLREIRTFIDALR
jgi:non-heme chloroperoxidase